MKAKKITQKELYALVTAEPSGVSLQPIASLKWDVAILVPDCSGGKNRFTRSVADYVDDPSKKAAFLHAISHLFHALSEENYQAVLSNSAVACKSARTFKFEGSTHKLWELKPNNKDRIYFYGVTDMKPPNRKTIFLLMVFHKKDKTTPDTAGAPCEDAIKDIIRAKGMIDFCKEKK